MKTFVLKQGPEKSARVYSIAYETLLNPQQLAAVMHQDGPALVIAGAGTGKTRTLVYRLARLVESGVDPHQILLLTFTRKAADEMLERAGQLLDNRCKGVKGGTFHHLSNILLHRFCREIGFQPNFSILDSEDVSDVIQTLRSQVKFDKKQSRFPQKSTLQAIFSGSLNRTIPVKELVEKEYPQFNVHVRAICSLFDEYQATKKRQGLMDFDDMLFYLRDLLMNRPDIAAQLSNEFRYIMVDEYQDTNRVQAEIVRLLSGRHQNVMAVGDDAQGIYSFRGADPDNIFRFPEAFSGSKLLLLEENYRSTQPILQLANRFLNFAERKYEKQLFTRKAGGDLPGLVRAPEERDQSMFITQMVLNLREQGMGLSDMAVLFRNARDSYDLEVELNKHQIPFVKIGGQRLTEAAHVKDVSAYLRVVNNPADLVAWNRILLLLEGIGPKTAAELIEWLQQGKDLFSETQAAVSGKYRKDLESLLEILKKAGERTPVSEKVELILSYYRPVVQNRYDDYPKRLKDLEVLQNLSAKYHQLDTFLNDLALEPVDATSLGAEKAVADEAPLVLSTIHSAKGLEWTAVFLVNCLDGVIPSAYALKKQAEVDEELRILYVAATRAREYLFFTYPAVQASGYGDYFTKPSRFFDGIDESMLEPWQLQFETNPAELPPAPPLRQLNA